MVTHFSSCLREVTAEACRGTCMQQLGEAEMEFKSGILDKSQPHAKSQAISHMRLALEEKKHLMKVTQGKANFPYTVYT